MLYAAHEIEYWAKKKKVDVPLNYEMFTSPTEVMLGPEQSLRVPIKIQTFRFVDRSTKAASEDNIVDRNVRISVFCGPTLQKTVELKLIPQQPTLDHTFRFYEPENSYFKVLIPPFI